MILSLIVFLVAFADSEAPEMPTSPETSAETTATLAPPEFAAHITASARTGEPGSFSLQRSPGANLNTDFLLTALFIGVTERLELGIIPAYFWEEEHRGHVLAKYNFWRSRQFHWAVSLGYSRFTLNGDIDVEGTPTWFDFDVDMIVGQIVMNYAPADSRLSYGVAIAPIFTRVGVTVGPVSARTGEDVYESGIDVAYAASEHFDVTFGTGFMRETGLTAYERSHLGFGSSVRWKRDATFFSTLTLGAHYTPKTENVLFLFSTKIFTYE